MRWMLPGVGIVLALVVVLGNGDQPVSLRVAAPEFAGVTEWLNSKPLKLADLKGQVVVVHFWTFG